MGKEITIDEDRFKYALLTAFVQGAKWWEFEKKGATMWNSDRRKAEKAGMEKLKQGELGIITNYPTNEQEKMYNVFLEEL